MRRPVFRFGLVGVPFGKEQEVAVLVGLGAGGWVEAGFVLVSGPHCLGHFVVDFEDNALCAVFTVLFLVLAECDGEGVHDVGDWVASSGSGLGNFVIFKRICLHSRKISALKLVFWVKSD